MNKETSVAQQLDDDSLSRPMADAIDGYTIYRYDSAGVIISWNAEAQRMKGYTASEVIGRNFSLFYTEADQKSGLPERALAIAKAQGSFQTEGWHVRKDGSRFWAHVRIDPVLNMAGDFINITLDLTPQKLAAEALQRSHDQVSAFDKSFTECAIYQLDGKGSVSTWHAGAENITGFGSDEIIGKNLELFYTKDDRSSGVPQRDLDMSARDGKFEGEAWRVRKNGEHFWAHVIIDVIHDQDGLLVGFLNITHDLTLVRNAVRAAESARAAFLQSQKMEAIGRVSGGVAHDFNNLLTVVMGGLEIIQRRLPSEPNIATLLENAIQATHRGRSLTKRLLGFARRQDLEPQAVDVAALVGGMSDLLRHTLGPFVTIETRFPSDLPGAIADPNQLELAILNLVTNARDAMPHGGLIQITASRVGADAGQGTSQDDVGSICISIADSGEGMDAVTLNRAHEAFFTTKEMGKGTGLGLPMVRGFAEQSGGRFSLKSTQGKGTMAELWLPAAVRGGLR